MRKIRQNDRLRPRPIGGATNPRGPQPGLPEYRPPRNLAEALEAARDSAAAEVCFVLAPGLSNSALTKKVADGSAYCAAETGALAILDHFFEADEVEPLWEVAGDLAEAATYQRRKDLSLLSPAELAAPPTPRSALLALQAHTLATIGPKRHPSRPLRPLDEAIALAFWDACEQFDNDFPEGVPFEALPSEVYQLFVQRGRNASFWILETCLPWSAAVKIAEAIGEAAWQFCARELACPRAAITAALN